MTLWLLSLALLPLIISSTISYSQRVAAIQQQGIAKLTAIRDIKVNQIETWIDERNWDLNVISSDHEIRRIAEALDKVQRTVEDQQYIIVTRELLQRYVGQYSELFIVDAKDGKVILSTDKHYEGDSRKKDLCFTEPLQSESFFIKDIYFSKALKTPAMAFSIPIFDLRDDSRINAILVARVDVKKSIYRLLLDRTGMGKTGETLIVNKDGLALNELRWYENAPLNLVINAEPALLASQGHTGVIEINDYRGEEVLAAYKYVPKTGWGFVAKQDMTEVYAPVQAMLLNLLIVFALSTLVIVFCSFYIAGRIVTPILRMKDVSVRLQEGELSARNSIDSNDEFGFLAKAINEMAVSIESQIKVQNNSSQIIKALVVSDDLSDFSYILLKNLLAITDSSLAAFYLLSNDGETFEALTSIGADTHTLQSFDAECLEGEFWTDGYFASTVGKHGNKDTIGKYVKSQGGTYHTLHVDNQLVLF